ncbi:MAG TPA: hypothetical protein VIL74_16060 [Pyrinomonadaceae bacterium]|jgi:hypothetical protein
MNSSTSEIEKIRLLREGEFTGTLYFEFAPGGFSGNHWREDSVYLSDEVFELIEPVFVKTIPGFGRYSPNEISRSDWELIINEFQALKETLVRASALSELREKMWFYGKYETLFFDRFDESRFAVLKLITDLNAWLRVQLTTHEKVSVLGI